MPSLHVLTHRQLLDPDRLADKCIVVMDVLFATTTIISALQAGVDRVVAAADPTRARAAAAGLDGAVLAGEARGEIPDGFAHFAPLRLRRAIRPGHTLVYSSSNGTPAILAAAGAASLLVGALVNAPALARHILERHTDRTVLLVCAGTLGALNLEDFYCAGCLAEHLLADTTVDWQPSDATLAALGVFRAQPAARCLHAARVGRIMGQRGLEDEVAHAARIGAAETIVTLSGDSLVRIRD